MIENIKTYKVLLLGRVQGVGFRYFVESIAGKYDISGYVRNTFDRKVEVVCQGEEEDLKQFIISAPFPLILSYTYIFLTCFVSVP